jgi:hypothetical protein
VTIPAYIATSALLVWAAVSDSRTRQVPPLAGYGLLLVAVVAMILRGWWMGALFLIIAIFGTRGGFAMLITVIAAFLLIEACGWGQCGPLLIGILVVYIMYSLHWIGGGDAQVAFALIGLTGTWMMLYFLAGGTILSWIVLVFFHSPGQALQRLLWVTKRLNKGPADDPSAVKTPWVVTAAFSAIAYFVVNLALTWVG